MVSEETKIRAALKVDASQIQLPSDLLDRINRQVSTAAHVRSSLWTRLRLGPKLELAVACIVLLGLVGLAAYRNINSIPAPAAGDKGSGTQVTRTESPARPISSIPTSPEERRKAIERLRTEMRGRPLVEQIAAVRTLDGAWAESMEQARKCFELPRQPTVSTDLEGKKIGEGFFEPCPYAYVRATVSEVEADLGGKVLRLTDPAFQLYDAQRMAPNPRVSHDPTLAQRAILTWYREENHPTVVTARIGSASVGRQYIEDNRDLESIVEFEDGSVGIVSVHHTQLDGSPFPYPWQETETRLAFVAGDFYYQLTAANITKAEIVALAESMK